MLVESSVENESQGKNDEFQLKEGCMAESEAEAGDLRVLKKSK